MAHLIVNAVATDTDGTYYAMMYWLYADNRREHIINLELQELGAKYEAYFCRSGRSADIPRIVFDHMNLHADSAADDILDLQDIIGELFTEWVELVDESLANNDDGSIDLTTSMLEMKKAA